MFKKCRHDYGGENTTKRIKKITIFFSLHKFEMKMIREIDNGLEYKATLELTFSIAVGSTWKTKSSDNFSLFTLLYKQIVP